MIIIIAGFLMGGAVLFPTLTEFLLVLNLLIPLYALVINIMRIIEAKRAFVRLMLIMHAVGSGLLVLVYLFNLTGLSSLIEPSYERWSALFVRPVLTYISTLFLISAHANLGNNNDANTDTNSSECK